MEIIHGTTDFEIKADTAVAIGKFDGVHLGHKKLLAEVLAAKKQGLLATVFTFDPLPEAVFTGNKTKGLMTRTEKEQDFEKMGIDVLIEFPMNKDTVGIDAAVFLKDILVTKLHAKLIIAGSDVTFGHKGQGNAALLEDNARRYGYKVLIVDKVRYHNREISSTYIKEEMKKGNLKHVGKMLGNGYEISGEVVQGKMIGRTLGMPTVNIKPEEDKLLPPSGVYFSKVYVKGREYKGITDIGTKPTVCNEERVGVETFIFDFEGDLYGEKITVELLYYERPEEKFDSKEALKVQLNKDLRSGRIFFTQRDL